MSKEVDDLLEKNEIVQHSYYYLNILISIRDFFQYRLERVMLGERARGNMPQKRSGGETESTLQIYSRNA